LFIGRKTEDRQKKETEILNKDADSSIRKNIFL